METKITKLDSSKVQQTISGDLTVSGHIVSPEFSKLMAEVESLKARLSGMLNPVAGEPGLGFAHHHYEELYNDNPGDTDDHIIACSSLPAGATSIAGYIRMESGTAGRSFYIKDAAGTYTWGIATNSSTTQPGRGFFWVPLNTSKQFAWAASNSDVTTASIRMVVYFG